ncbi:MAG: hypothetical protein OXE46_15335 [Chloroflexi bacterium]|nr:hypothetical protein [Chloroflexota bacterium]
MAQSARQFDNEPPRQPVLSPNEQRIANAVVAALSPRLNSIDNRLDSIDNRLDSIDKRLDVLEQEMRGVNKILAAAELIPDNPDI